MLIFSVKTHCTTGLLDMSSLHKEVNELVECVRDILKNQLEIKNGSFIL
jgi:hypothetical protein